MRGAYIGAFLMYSQGVYANILNVIVFFMALRFISVEEVGVFSGFTIATQGAAIFGLFAIPNIIYQTIPTLFLNKNEYSISQMFRRTILFGSAAGAVILAVLIIFSAVISQSMFQSEEYSDVIVLAAIAAPLQILAGITTAFLISLRQVRSVAINLVITATIRNGAGILFLLFGLGLNGLVYAVIIGDTIVVVAHLISLKKYFYIKAGVESMTYDNSIRKMIAAASPIHLSKIIGFFRSSIDKFLILLLSDPSVLGMFSVASTVMRPMGMIALSVHRITLPDLSTYKIDDLYKRSKLVSRYLFMATIPLGIMVSALARPMVSVLAGPQYEQAIFPFMIIGVTFSVTVWIDALGISTAQVAGKSRKILYANLIGLVIGIALSFILIPQLSVLGAAMARGAVQIASFLALLIFIRRDAIDMGFLLVALLAAGIGGSLIFIIDNYLRIDWLIPFYLIVGGVIYLLVLRIMKVIKSPDIQTIKTNTPKKMAPLVNVFEKIVVSKH